MAKTAAIVPTDTRAVICRVNSLLPDANAGDRPALVELRRTLDAHPALWAAMGDLAGEAERALMRAAVGSNDDAQAEIARRLAALRTDLGRPGSSPLEQLLIDPFVLCWLSLTVAEAMYHRALERGLQHTDEAWHQRRVERSERRYLAAIKALAVVRRLGVPAVQVNIGEKQINVAG